MDEIVIERIPDEKSIQRREIDARIEGTHEGGGARTKAASTHEGGEGTREGGGARTRAAGTHEGGEARTRAAGHARGRRGTHEGGWARTKAARARTKAAESL